MKWGLITDTHDKFALVRKAIACFEKQGCAHVFHTGDFNGDRIAELFTGRKFQFHYVTDHSSHDRKMRNFRADVLDERIDVNSVFAFHDTYPCERPGRVNRVRMIDEAIASAGYDFVFYGHLHYFNLKLPSRGSETIAINSGGLYHKDLSTFCVLDVANGLLDVYYLVEKSFVPILRFDLAKRFDVMQILDEPAARIFSEALMRLRWNQSDRTEHTFSMESSDWFCKNYKLLFDRFELRDQPGFFA
ncbi:MAG: metallophosphoesterase family protein [Candidatus Omnitrophica bacterium]|nr:metallophosphoesterase family protein [Candidatus Omnitrophota bacterium]